MLAHQIIQAFGQGQQQLVIAANTTNVNLFTLAGSPTTPVDLSVTIAADVIFGSTSPTIPAFDVGQFPAGSKITIINLGDGQGAGGLPNGGTGGDVFKADYPNQTVTIINRGKARAGGGGGGKGGTGGQGGQGSVITGYNYAYSRTVAPEFYIVYNEFHDFNWSAVWNGNVVASGSGGPPVTFSGGQYKTGVLRESLTRVDHELGGTYQVEYYEIGQATTSATNGGAGGAGGNGGKGRGYEGTNAPGALGTDGSPGDTNAGSGGKGGQGGGGGDFGASGTNGLTGSIGNAGTVSGGASGLAGVPGALAGCYLRKGTANVTFINEGTIAGRLA